MFGTARHVSIPGSKLSGWCPPHVMLVLMLWLGTMRQWQGAVRGPDFHVCLVKKARGVELAAMYLQAVGLSLACLSFDFFGTCMDDSSEDLSTIQVHPAEGFQSGTPFASCMSPAGKLTNNELTACLLTCVLALLLWSRYSIHSCCTTCAGPVAT